MHTSLIRFLYEPDLFFCAQLNSFKYCCILTSNPAKYAIPKSTEVAYSIGVGDLGWQYGTGLKSPGTIINWCTRREWPVNCMTVISARWRSNMPFQRRSKCIFRWPVMGRYWVGVWLLYNSVHRKFKEFGERCGRESQHPAKGALRPPINEFLGIRQVGDKMR